MDKTNLRNLGEGESYALINNKVFDLEKHQICASHLELTIMHDPDEDLEIYRSMRVNEKCEPVCNEIVLNEHKKTTSWSGCPLASTYIDFNTYRVTLRFKI